MAKSGMVRINYEPKVFFGTEKITKYKLRNVVGAHLCVRP